LPFGAAGFGAAGACGELAAQQPGAATRPASARGPAELLLGPGFAGVARPWSRPAVATVGDVAKSEMAIERATVQAGSD
jgi:hypothetical protein